MKQRMVSYCEQGNGDSSPFTHDVHLSYEACLIILQIKLVDDVVERKRRNFVQLIGWWGTERCLWYYLCLSASGSILFKRKDIIA
jgi:hypothetical protein